MAIRRNKVIVLLVGLMFFPGWLKADSFCFVVTADTQGGENGVSAAELSEIVQATIDEGAAFFIAAGDLVDGDSDPNIFQSQLLNWRSIVEPLYDAGIGVYPIRGNHEINNSDPKATWDSVFSGDYALPGNGPTQEQNITYSFTHNNVFVVGLDQYITPHRVNQLWLDGQFASNSQPHIFVFGHEPAFRLFHADCLAQYPIDRNIFWSSIADEGGRVYFCGHDHSYDHIRLDDGDGNPDNDVHQIISLGGNKFYPDAFYDGNNGQWVPLRISHRQSAYGYILVEIDGADATLTFKYRSAAGVFEVCNVFSYTTEPVDAPLVEFEDANLKAAVSAELNVSDPNTDDILNLVTLDAQSLAIASLDGLQYAKNITQLNLSGNYISDISALASLACMSYLYLDGNALNRAAYCHYLLLIAQNNPGLTLSYDPNPNPADDCVVCIPDPNLLAAVETELALTDPNFTDMCRLTVLDARHLGISNLTGLEQAPSLMRLYLGRNSCSDISALSRLKFLTDLGLQGDNIGSTSILVDLSNLTWLDIFRNQISDISNLTGLRPYYLRLDDNPLNSEAYCKYLPLIAASNPGIELSYDDDPNPLTVDCSIDLADLVDFAGHWLETDCNISNNWCSGADLNHLDNVNLDDFAEVTLYWLAD